MSSISYLSSSVNEGGRVEGRVYGLISNGGTKDGETTRTRQNWSGYRLRGDRPTSL